jgi:hypothetical protein
LSDVNQLGLRGRLAETRQRSANDDRCRDQRCQRHESEIGQNDHLENEDQAVHEFFRCERNTRVIDKQSTFSHRCDDCQDKQSVSGADPSPF